MAGLPKKKIRYVRLFFELSRMTGAVKITLVDMANRHQYFLTGETAEIPPSRRHAAVDASKLYVKKLKIRN